MDDYDVTAAKMRSLISDEHRDLLEALELMRGLVIDMPAFIPRIQICGTHTFTNNTLLQALAGLPSPIEKHADIKFPIEYQFRKSWATQKKATIVEYEEDSKQQEASRFVIAETLTSFDQMGDAVSRAEVLITSPAVNHSSPWILRFEALRPEHDDIDVVQLPESIFDENTHGPSPANASSLIARIYPFCPDTINLLVVSALGDINNLQRAANVATAADSNKLATIGIITDIDRLAPGSSAERLWLGVASNIQTILPLGWHILQDKDLAQGLLEEGNDMVTAMSWGKPWCDYPVSQRGIETLIYRMRSLLYDRAVSHVSTFLPSVERSLSQWEDRLEALIGPGDEPTKQRSYLRTLSEKFQEIVQQDADGSSFGPFFNRPQSREHENRITLAAQNITSDFQTGLLSITTTPFGQDEVSKVMHKLVELHRETLELVDPSLIFEGFLDLSSFWEHAADVYVDKIFQAIWFHVLDIFNFLTSSATSSKILRSIVGPKLDGIARDMKQRSKELIMTYRQKESIHHNRHLLTTISDSLQAQKTEKITKLMQTIFGISIRGDECLYIQPAFEDERNMRRILETHISPISGRSTAEAACGCLRSYYRQISHRFVDELSRSVTNKGLVLQLKDVFSESDVMAMSEDTVRGLLEETEIQRHTIRTMEAQISDLKKGMERCKVTPSFWALDHAIRDGLKSSDLYYAKTCRQREETGPQGRKHPDLMNKSRKSHAQARHSRDRTSDPRNSGRQGPTQKNDNDNGNDEDDDDDSIEDPSVGPNDSLSQSPRRRGPNLSNIHTRGIARFAPQITADPPTDNDVNPISPQSRPLGRPEDRDIASVTTMVEGPRHLRVDERRARMHGVPPKAWTAT